MCPVRYERQLSCIMEMPVGGRICVDRGVFEKWVRAVYCITEWVSAILDKSCIPDCMV